MTLQEVLDRPISYSALKHFMRSPAHYLHYRQHRPDPTPVMVFGNLVDCLLFTPEVFEKQFYVFDEKQRPDKKHTMKSKANQIWKFQQYGKANKMKQLVTTQEDIVRANQVIKAIKDDPTANTLVTFRDNVFQKKIFWEKRGKKCVGVLDIDNPSDFTADLKITGDADPDKWPRMQAISLKYYIQAGMYSDGLKKGHLDTYSSMKPFYFIVVEDKEPFGVCVYRASHELLAKGIEIYTKEIERLLECEKRREFPSYSQRAMYDPDEYDGVHVLDLPNWMK